MRTRTQVLVLALSLTLLPACGDSTRPTPAKSIPIHGLAPTAVSNPVISPLDSTIGFNHTPILSIHNDGSYYYADYADTAGGFWLLEWNGSNPRRAADYLSDVSMSPDGATLLYSDWGRIRSVRLSNGEFEPGGGIEYTLPGTFWGPKWDPTMTKMAVWSSGPIYTSPGVYIWNASTQDWRRVGEIGWRDPDWSPNGATLVCVGYVGQNEGLFLIEESGDSARSIVVFERVYDPTWAPDGNRIAFIARVGSGDYDYQLYTIASDGSDLRRITTEGAGGDMGFAWSPSGSEIVFVRHRFGDWACSGGNYVNGTLWRVNLETGERKQLTFNYPVRCPDGVAQTP